MPAIPPSAEPRPGRGTSRQQGFALLIMLIIVVMGSLYAVTSQLEVATRKYARDEATLKALATAKEALIGYAVTYRDDPSHSTEVFGYLPCPDSAPPDKGTALAGDGAAAGSCGSAGQAVVGLLPYKTLGLPDLRDAEGGCLWYAVSGSFKNNPKASATVMNWDTQGQFSIAGTSVSPDQGDGGAVAVIFAPGVPLSSQNRSGLAQPCNADPAQVSAYLDGNYTFATSATIPITQGSSGSATNNDRIAWITPKEIFDKLVKRQDFSNLLSATPPGQVNKLTDEIKAVLEKNIQDDLVAGINTLPTSQLDPTGYTQFGKQIGNLPTTMSLYDATYNNYYNNWNEQYRQAMCASLTTPCLTLAGTTCRGGLMFGGRTANGQPRPSTQKTATTANLGYYFESPTVAPVVAGGGLDILNSAATTFSGNTAYAATTPSADIGTCLFPGTFISFAQNIAAFSAGTVLSSGTSPVASVTGGGTPSVNLGSSTPPASSRSGCVWNNTPFPLGTTLRLYFKFRITTSGQGFTLALADAATNNIASANPIMCGSTTNSLLGYAGYVGAPSPISAGIKPPKLGLEFDTSSNSSRNDPSSDHFAFLYWGSAGDNSPTLGNTGNDDNTHYFGILGSGSEPLNPRDLSLTTATATPIATLAAASWSSGSGTVSATTSAPHGFATGQSALISDTTSTGFDPDTIPVPVTVTDATHFSYALGANPGSYTYGTTASRTALTVNASWSGGTVTVSTDLNHGFSAGQFVNISGIRPVGYNGTYQIAAIIDPQTFTYVLASNPGSYSVDGFVTATNKIASASWASGIVTVTTSANHGLALQKQITGASWSGGMTTITTAASHGFVVGQAVNISGISPAGYNGYYPIASVPNSTSFKFAQASAQGSYVSGGWVSAGDMVNISGISPAGYNGSFPVTATDATHFTYALATNPGASYTGATFATPGISTVKSPYFPAGGSMPLASDIHVRLDITRAYDATAKRATFTLKAYVDNLFPLSNNCLSSDFQNMARDLSAFCPLRTPTIEQDNIVINDVSGPALSNIYVGFTTARGTSSSDNQNISIYNLLVRSQ